MRIRQGWYPFVGNSDYTTERSSAKFIKDKQARRNWEGLGGWSPNNIVLNEKEYNGHPPYEFCSDGTDKRALSVSQPEYRSQSLL